jgi:hypothetical protein
MKKLVDEKSCEWNSNGWHSEWMKKRLEEIAARWNSQWMKKWLDEKATAWISDWMTKWLDEIANGQNSRGMK